MKIAILTRPDFRSPRILAESLKLQLEQQSVEVEILDEVNLLSRLVSFKNCKLSIHFWLKRKLQFFYKDATALRRLKKFDAIVISECTPNAFLKSLYNIEKFKKNVQKPVGLYEVYYLGNAPTQLAILNKNKDALLDRFDFHLSVSSVTEIRQPTSAKWYPIGLLANCWQLLPLPKKEIIAILDFVHPGNEHYREAQINALNKTGIKYISLEKPYSFEEIRNIYRQGAIYFMQSSEAFGIPILECLCCGCQIFTPASWWPMSWRLNESPEVHGEGDLPKCFTIYNNEDDLYNKLMDIKKTYNLIETPKKVFANFLQNYPHFYYGNQTEVKSLIKFLKNKNGEK